MVYIRKMLLHHFLNLIIAKKVKVLFSLDNSSISNDKYLTQTIKNNSHEKSIIKSGGVAEVHAAKINLKNIKEAYTANGHNKR